MRSALRPVTVTASRPVETTLAPAFASSVMTSVRSRSPQHRPVAVDATARRSSTRGVRDQPTAADHDQVVGGLLQLAHEVARDEDRPALGGERAQEASDPHDALGVEAVDRLVEHQHRRVAEQRGGDAEPLPPSRARTRRCAGRRRPRVRRGRGPRRRAIGGMPLLWPATAGGRGRGGPGARPRRRAAPRPRAGGIACSRTARRRSAPFRRPARSSPRIMRIVVDLPAPLGPTNPVTRPGRRRTSGRRPPPSSRSASSALEPRSSRPWRRR